MWLYCKSGFFSAVQHCERPNTIHLRARFEGDIERLFKRHRVKAEVTFTPNNDYAWRADIKKRTWARILAAEADDIDYSNFKNRVHDGTERDVAYMGAWTAMRRSQENELAGQTRIVKPYDRLVNDFEGPENWPWTE